VVRAAILAALLALWPIATAAQNSVDEMANGYSASAMRGYWNGARDIQNEHHFELEHGDAVDAVDAVEGGSLVLSVDRYDEEGSTSRTWLVSHCERSVTDGGRPRNCRYRVVASHLIGSKVEPEFEAVAAAARLRAAGVSPEAFALLAKQVPLTEGVPKHLPQQWAEARRAQSIIAAPFIADFAARHSITVTDSKNCPPMLRSVKKLDGLGFEPMRITGVSNDPKWRASIPHSPIFEFAVLSGLTTLRWGESATTRIGNRILDSLREIENDCPSSSVATN
jgi:hypothetical protein